MESGALQFSDISTLSRVGKATTTALQRLGIFNFADILNHFPVRYEDFSALLPVADLKPEQFVTVRVRVQQVRARRAWGRWRMQISEGLVADASGSLRVVWFGQHYIVKALTPGEEIFLSGRVRSGKLGLQLVNPTYEKVSDKENLHTARLVPMYPLTAGISQKQFRNLVAQVLERVGDLPNFIASDLRPSGAGFVNEKTALRAAHFPVDLNEAAVARNWFDFNEAVLIQLVRARAIDSAAVARAIPFVAAATKKFVDHLPFVLTADQKKSAFAILKDLERARPMNRLLQGDVGSGKTVVAAIAAEAVARAGAQTVLLAPTQILAEQHAATLQTIFSHTNIPVVLKTATHKNKIPDEPCVIVGTHALIASKVKFFNVALAVVDEQHRFGVAQRRALKEKNLSALAPHFLSMTATPIPRSLALALFGDLAVSRLETMPLGRKIITTRVVAETNRARAVAFARAHVAAGEQVFVVAPIIDPSDALGVESATELYERLVAEDFKNLRVGLLHGRLPARERVATMEAMRAGELDVLVATPVIEVGVDIPAATIMWIESAERFGLAQLHQLRGRVGRGAKQSYCFLFSESMSERASERLDLMAKNSSGFVLAEKDLEMRGSGELWGTLQSGFDDWERWQNISAPTWEAAQQAAQKILASDKNLAAPEHAEIARRLEQRETKVHRE